MLTGVDFEVQAGEVVCLLGPNGAGKTTTIEILEGFRRRSAGEVDVLGQDSRDRLGGLAGLGRGGAAVVARPRPLVAAPAARAPRLLLRAVLDPPAPASRDVEELITTVGLTEYADRKFATLSGGQRRRLDVAVGIVGRPELLFLDEPTAASTRRPGATSTTWCIDWPTWTRRSC